MSGRRGVRYSRKMVERRTSQTHTSVGSRPSPVGSGESPAAARSAEAADDGFIALEPDLAIRPTKAGRERSELVTLLRYAGIGATAVLVDVATFMLLYNVVGLGEVWAQSISVAVAVVYSFTLNARWNFKVDDRLLSRFLSFVAVSFVGYLAGLAIILAASNWFDLSPNIGKIISLPVVFVIQYSLNRVTSFRATTQHPDG